MKLRNGFLACLLAALTTLSGPASLVARAQLEQTGAAAAPTRKGYSPLPPEQGHAYLVTMTDRGAVCRDATPAERRQILDRDPTVKTGPVRDLGLVQSDALRADATDSKTSGANLVAGHLDIVLRPTAQLQANPEALAAFERAAATWENLITSEITVVIDVDYGTTRFGKAFGDNVLGSTSGGIFYAPPYADVRNRLNRNATPGEESAVVSNLPAGGGVPTDSGTLTEMDVASPIARALGAVAPHANPSDTTGNDSLGKAPSIGFNSTFQFDFDPSNGITAGRIDFDAVVTHEIGHALGFESEVGLLEVAPTATLRPTVWDLFRFRPGVTLSTFATAPRVLTTGGEQRHFDGAPELGLSTGNPSGDNGDGEQASHWKDDRFTGGLYIGIMDPTLPSGSRRTMTANDRRAIDFLGYNLGAAPAAPANDNFASAVVLQGQSGSVTGTNANATREAGEPDSVPGVTVGGRSVWYAWTAPATGTATFDTIGSDFDTTLSVYTGGAVNALSPVTNNDDIDTQGGNVASRVQFSVTAGTLYRIKVDGFDGDSGNIKLNWTSTGTTPSQFFSVSGRVTDAAGNGVANVRIGLDGPPLPNGLQYPVTVTNASGFYTVSNLSVGAAYTISPIADGPYSFSPGPTTFSSGGANLVINFTASAGNPIDGSAKFVEQHYLDFLGRQADASGLAFWTAEIEGCQGNLSCRAVKRINVSAAFFLSIEFQETGYLVYRIHKTAYGDMTEASTGLVVPVIRREEFIQDAPIISAGVVVGQGPWQQQIEDNKNAYALAFVQRARFTTAFPASLTPTQFVDKLNSNTGGVLSGTERANLIGELTANNTVQGRASVLRKVAENAELDRREKNRAFVLMQYYGYLRRNPDDAPEQNRNFAGFNFWLGKLNEFNGNFVQAEMVKAFLDSIEYRRRFAQ